MRKFFLLISLVTVFNFTSCEKTEEDYVPPSVVTVKAEPLSSGGVLLYGDFRNFSSSDELGFVVSNNSNYILSNPSEGENTIHLSKGFYFDQEYLFQAYIKTAEEVFYGLQESFLSTGSSKISFSGIEPNKGNYYEVVELNTNEELTENDREGIKVYFNNVEAEIQSIESNKLICVVPYFEGSHVSNIKIKYFGRTMETSLRYELLPPSIASISPTEVSFEDEFIINGGNFENGYNAQPRVFIGGEEANILEKTGTTLKVKLPNTVKAKRPSIRVISNQQEITENNLIELKDPIINTYPISVNVLDEITLYGENFNPEVWENTVYFNNTKATIISGDAKQIKVKVPTGVYDDWEPSIRIEVTNELKSGEYPITILDAAIEVNNDVEVDIINFQVIDSDIYAYGANPYKPGILEIYKYSIENNEFYDKKEVGLPFQNGYYIVKSDSEYLYIYFKRDISDFYRLSLITGNIDKLADFPGPTRIMGHGIAYNGNIYLGAGRTGTTYDNIDYGDFYKYNVMGNNWEQVPDILDVSTYDYIYANFYQNDLAYIYLNNYSNNIRILKFDGTQYNDLNLTLSDPFDYPNRRINFFKDNKFYLVEESNVAYENIRIRIFDTVDNSWKLIPNVVPVDDDIIGIMQFENTLYVETVDYYLKRHLFKVDLTRL